MNEHFEIAVIGAGMAGASMAAELLPHAKVALLEAEDQPGYHSTGRSAAFWTESYGGPGVQPLTSASGPYLEQHGFLTGRGALNIARGRQQSEIDQFLADFAGSGVRMALVDRAGLEEKVPGLLPQWSAGVWEPDCKDIDVGALHTHYLSLAGKHGCQTRCRFQLAEAVNTGAGWRLTSRNGAVITCDVIVNAAGAWADDIAAMAGVRPLGIRPFRRTVVQLRTDPAPAVDLPLVVDLAGDFYFKPENGRVWLSPHDETPSPASDVAPEELDVALAIDRFEQAVDWRIEAVEHRWAGLRSFSPDRLPVYGRDPGNPAFFWFAGQGGFGIQTAPAAAKLGAQILLGLPECATTSGLDRPKYDPARFS